MMLALLPPVKFSSINPHPRNQAVLMVPTPVIRRILICTEGQINREHLRKYTKN